jgi:hypothetical protein
MKEDTVNNIQHTELTITVVVERTRKSVYATASDV